MKNTLPERSLVIKDKLDSIVKEILAISESRISMIILFGSYARGDWVQDKYTIGHITYTYESDIDLFIVLNGDHEALNLEYEILKNLESKGLTLRGIVGELEASVTLVLEPIDHVNEKLEQKHYFFTDIKKEGILLYDSGEFKLSEAKELPLERLQEIAKKDYNHWFTKGNDFFMSSKYQLERKDYSLAAFSLHQATESFYNTILLVFSGYKPKLHDILKLGTMARNYDQELCCVFPWETKEQKQCFKLLLNAYIDARYNRGYKITKEQLLYLMEKVENLKNLTEKICLEWINRKPN